MTEEEIDALQVGSVFRAGPRKIFRIVRGVWRSSKTGKLVGVWCAKRVCSRYPSPLACVDRSFLRRLCEATDKVVELNHPLDKALEHDCDETDMKNLMVSCHTAKELPA